MSKDAIFVFNSEPLLPFIRYFSSRKFYGKGIAIYSFQKATSKIFMNLKSSSYNIIGFFLI